MVGSGESPLRGCRLQLLRVSTRGGKRTACFSFGLWCLLLNVTFKIYRNKIYQQQNLPAFPFIVSGLLLKETLLLSQDLCECIYFLVKFLNFLFFKLQCWAVKQSDPVNIYIYSLSYLPSYSIPRDWI